jgi:RimJ/RimL family protein N-acetyltransferase
VDIGFAFLPRFWGKGYAYESASAVMTYAKNVLGLDRIVAITSLDNDRSISLLGKLGFRFEKMFRMPSNEEVKLFASGV